jgi:tripartite-type tricarboxylate transporter receptor subunit TctC
MKTLVQTLALLCAAFGLVAAPSSASADDFPDKPIHLVVATAAGGASDIVARIVAEKLSQRLGQPVYVDPKPGANGNIAAEYVARAPADGYTLMMGTVGVMAVNPAVYPDVRFNPLKDYTAVARLVSFSNILVVNPKLPIHSVKELIAYAKAHPGALHYGSPGVGGSPHMAMVVFAQMAGIDVTHVPYKGAAPALVDIMGGHIEMAFSDPLVTLEQIKDGRVRALAVSGARRLSSAPDIPTVAEAGVPGYAVSGWLGIVAPAGTPADRVAKLNTEINAVLADPAVRQKLEAQGSEIIPGTVADFQKFINDEYTRWGAVVKSAHLTQTQ